MNPLRRTALPLRRSLVTGKRGTGQAHERVGEESMRAVRCVLFLFFLSLSASAQVRESITVSYVEVPVTVVDRSGNAVRGLTKANFEIIDEGTKRAITGFDAVDFASSETAAPGAAITSAARRNFLLVFDLTFSSPSSMARAKEAARQFVTKMAGEQDRIGVATVDVARGFRVLTSFTTDRVLVEAAIASPKDFSALDPLQLAGSSISKEILETMNMPMNRYNLKKGAGGYEENDYNTDQVRSLNQQQDSYNRGNVEREVNLLAGLAKIMRAVRGPKHLVLLSEGFDARLVQGRDAGIGQEKIDEYLAAENGHIWQIDNDNRYGSSATMSLVTRMADVAKRCDVILDAVDIRGLRVQVDAREGLQKRSNEGLHLLAGVTGGTVFQNSNDLANDLQRVLKAQEVVYVLAFQAPASQAGKFHEMKVRLIGVPGGRAVARSGYYEAGGDSAAERTLSNAEIIVNDVPEEGVHVESLAVPFSTPGGNAQVPVILEIDGKDVASGATGTATLEIFTYAFDMDGKVRDAMYQRAALDLNKVGATLGSTGVKYYATLSLPPGKYAVKSLVRVAETDKKGFVRTDVVVPSKGELFVSQPLFQDHGASWVMVKGGSHDRTNAAYPFELNGDPFVPTAGVRLNGEPRRFVVFVENAAADEVTVETDPTAKLITRLRNDRGSKFVFELAPQAATSVLNVRVRKHDERTTMTSAITLH